MHATKLLHNIISMSSSIHRSRLTSLLNSVESVLYGSSLMLTNIGRGINSKAKTKNKIKSVDRLLGNKNLRGRERIEMYKALAPFFLGGNPQPTILIDWTRHNKHEHDIIRASLAFKGRSITIFETAYRTSEYNQHETHKEFLFELNEVLPEGCKPIIVTDAGYRTDWFKQVLALGWDYLGRIRNAMTYWDKTTKTWKKCINITPAKLNKAEYVDKTFVTQRSKLEGHLVVYQARPKGRKTLKGKEDHHNKHRKSNKDGWLLMTSLDCSDIKNTRKMVRLYSKRMQIEQSFRDLKNDTYGSGFSKVKTKKVERLNVILLIAFLAEMVFFIMGVLGERQKKHFDYQANSRREKRIISVPRLGSMIIRNNRERIKKPDVFAALKEISNYWKEEMLTCY